MEKTSLSLDAQVASLSSMIKSNANGTTESSLPSVAGKPSKSVTKYKAGKASDLQGRNGNLIDINDLKKVGITNFENGNRLPAGKYFLCTGVRLLLDATNGVTPQTATWKTEAPANWKNGEIIISQSGTGKLAEFPVTDIANWKASTGNDADFRQCEFLLRPEAEFEILSVLPAAAGDEVYRIEFRGYEYTDSSKN